MSVVTQIATTVIAGFGAWIAFQTFLRTPVQETEPDKAEVTAWAVEEPKTVKVFATSKQETWLKVTDNRLECHLTDKRQGKRSGLQWQFSKKQAKEILFAHDFRVYPGCRLNSGVFAVGPAELALFKAPVSRASTP